MSVLERQEDKGVISQKLSQTRHWTQSAVIPPIAVQETLSYTLSATGQEMRKMLPLLTHTHTQQQQRHTSTRPGGLHQELGMTSGEALSSAGCWRCTYIYAVNSREKQFVGAEDKTANK